MEFEVVRIREQEHIFYCPEENIFCSFIYNNVLGMYNVETWNTEGRVSLEYMSMNRIMEKKEADSRFWDFVGVL